MSDAVRDAWQALNIPFEGKVMWFYLDTHRPPLVTIAMGNYVPRDVAVTLSMVNPDGTPATPEQIGAEWDAVQANAALSEKGYRAAEKVTTLRLTDAGYAALVYSKYDSDLAECEKTFPKIRSMPADARLGIMSMAWAMGPDFEADYPHFTTMIRTGNFMAAAAQCHMSGSPEPFERNAMNRQAFLNAASVLANGGDPAVLLTPVPA